MSSVILSYISRMCSINNRISWRKVTMKTYQLCKLQCLVEGVNLIKSRLIKTLTPFRLQTKSSKKSIALSKSRNSHLRCVDLHQELLKGSISPLRICSYKSQSMVLSKGKEDNLQGSSNLWGSKVKKLNARPTFLSRYQSKTRKLQSTKTWGASRWNSCKRRDRTFCLGIFRSKRFRRKDELRNAKRFRKRKSSLRQSKTRSWRRKRKSVRKPDRSSLKIRRWPQPELTEQKAKLMQKVASNSS